MRDYDIRQALHVRINSIHEQEPDTVVVNELGVCQGAARVDVAVINGILHGYEIKSEQDNLRRLPHQIELYGKVFDRVTLVLNSRHFGEAFSLIPDWWEVVVATPSTAGLAHLSEERPGNDNPNICARAVAELLWRSEALMLLAARNADHGVRSLPRRQVWDRLCEVYSLSEIKDAVRQCLKARKGQQVG